MLTRTNTGQFIRRISKETEQEIIEMYQSGMAMKPVGKLFGIGGPTVYKILKRNNITTRNNRKYVFNECYFDIIDTEEKAYWLGFLMGDGSIVGNKLSIPLNKKDISQLEKFKKALEATYHIKYCESNDSCYFYVHSAYFVKKLAEYGIVSDKDFKTYTPNIPIELLPAFYRGCVDADGTIGKYRQGTTWLIGLAGTTRLLTECSKYISNELNIKERTIRATESNSFKITWDGNQLAYKVAKFLYGNATIFLDRKNALFEQMEQDLNIINTKKNRCCSVEGCTKKHYAKGYCSKHYQRLERKEYRKDYYENLDKEERNRKWREWYHKRKDKNAF